MTSSPALISAFAVVWALTLACLVLLVCRWSRPSNAAPRDRGGVDGMGGEREA
ncbi:hypothetical protein [Streptomyces halobius]|uniref:Uncharacterized protein n=1 Tax=Streptomyces halobius TaxID=2879846 RepID=A0ABY4LYT4_9ACTN|nr:hypothetical protein [Streptomyces halobius]UQA90657.1 hypothetical protein K9S39_00980 [Streptomyces halobius]